MLKSSVAAEPTTDTPIATVACQNESIVWPAAVLKSEQIRKVLFCYPPKTPHPAFRVDVRASRPGAHVPPYLRKVSPPSVSEHVSDRSRCAQRSQGFHAAEPAAAERGRGAARYRPTVGVLPALRRSRGVRQHMALRGQRYWGGPDHTYLPQSDRAKRKISDFFFNCGFPKLRCCFPV